MTAHSYSAIKAFEQCPRKFHDTKVVKLYPREETEQTLYGTELHRQAELHLLEGRPLDESFKFLQPIMDSLKQMPGRILCEHKMGVTESLLPCEFDSPLYWSRGIADLIIVDDENLTARVFDYKSGGNKYPDTDQLMLMALLIFAHFPHIRRVTGGLLFVLKNTVSKYRVEREQADDLWWRWKERVAKLDNAYTHGRWPERSSGLCKRHCEVIHCAHNGRRS